MKKTMGALTTGAVTAGLLAIPAGASAAPTLGAPLQKCYTANPPQGVASIPVTLTGGIPGDDFQLIANKPGGLSGGSGSSTGTFDASGNGTTTLTDVYPPGDSPFPLAGKTIDLSAEDFNVNGDTSGPVGSFLVTNRALEVDLGYYGDHKSHYVSVSGTQFAGKQLSAFVVHNSRVIARVALGRGNVCGYARRKVSIIQKHTAEGRYILYVNAGTRLNKRAALSQAYTVFRF